MDKQNLGLMTTGQPFQIPLSIGLRDDARFENFFEEGNELVCDSLKQVAAGSGESLVFLWGARGAGCSHLLQAVCHEAEPMGRTSIYLPMDELIHLDSTVLEGMEHLDLICLDNIQAVAGRPSQSGFGYRRV